MPNMWDNFEKMRKGADQDVKEALVEKMGARMSDKDMKAVQAMHDTCAKVCESVHCSTGNAHPGADADREPIAGMLGKAGARHSQADLMKFKAIHDACLHLGAKC